MKPIICKNDIRAVLRHLQDYLDSGGIMRSAYVVDHTKEQIVVLLSDKKITDEMAEIWWSGFTAALGDQANEK